MRGQILASARWASLRIVPDPVDPALAARVTGAPILMEQNFTALQVLQGRNLPDPVGAAPYHADLACVTAAFLCGALDGLMRARPRRGSNLAGYQGDLALVAYTQAVTYLAVATGNDELLTGRNGSHIQMLLRARKPELSRPVDTHIAGGDALQVGAQVSSLAVVAAESNRFKTKVERLQLTMSIPTGLRLTREAVEEHVGVSWTDLLRPLV